MGKDVGIPKSKVSSRNRMYTGRATLRIKKIIDYGKRKTCTRDGKCNDTNPKTVKRHYVVPGPYIEDLELCDVCKEKEWFQLYQKEEKI